MADMQATFVGGPWAGLTMVLPTQNSTPPETIQVGDYPNDNTVLVRPEQEFEARWTLVTYAKTGVVGDLVTYTVT